MNKFILLLLTTGLMLTSCKKANKNCTSENFPFLKEGNEWTFYYWDWAIEDENFKIKVVEDLGNGKFDMNISDSQFIPNNVSWQGCKGEVTTEIEDNEEFSGNAWMMADT